MIAHLGRRAARPGRAPAARARADIPQRRLAAAGGRRGGDLLPGLGRRRLDHRRLPLRRRRVHRAMSGRRAGGRRRRARAADRRASTSRRRCCAGSARRCSTCATGRSPRCAASSRRADALLTEGIERDRRGRHRRARPLPRDQRLRRRHGRRRRRGRAGPRHRRRQRPGLLRDRRRRAHGRADPRRLAQAAGAPQRVARSGHWGLDDLRPLRRLHGRTLGLLGYGRIAREVAVRARAAWGCRCWPTTRTSRRPRRATACACAAARSCCAPATCSPSTCRARRRRPAASTPATLALLPPGAVVVNAGRGAVLDEDALLAALRSGRVGGGRAGRPAPRARAARPPAAGAGDRRLHAAHGVLQRGVAARPAPRRGPERADGARGWRPGLRRQRGRPARLGRHDGRPRRDRVPRASRPCASRCDPARRRDRAGRKDLAPRRRRDDPCRRCWSTCPTASTTALPPATASR